MLETERHCVVTCGFPRFFTEPTGGHALEPVHGGPSLQAHTCDMCARGMRRATEWWATREQHNNTYGSGGGDRPVVSNPWSRSEMPNATEPFASSVRRGRGVRGGRVVAVLGAGARARRIRLPQQPLRARRVRWSAQQASDSILLLPITLAHLRPSDITVTAAHTRRMRNARPLRSTVPWRVPRCGARRRQIYCYDPTGERKKISGFFF